MNRFVRGGLIAVGAMVAGCLGCAGTGTLLPSELAYETSREIDAPPERIYDFLDDVEGLDRMWTQAMATMAPGGAPPMQIVALGDQTSGAGTRLAFKAGDMTMEEWTIVESQPPTRIVYDVDFQILIVRRTIELTPVDADTTRVRWAEAGTASNPLVRWMAFVQGDSVVENFDMALAALEAVAEAP